MQEVEYIRNKIKEKGYMTATQITLELIKNLDHKKIEDVITETKPDILYHFGAQPAVKPSWKDPARYSSSNFRNY